MLTLARNTLAVNLRFLDRALYRLELKSGEKPWFASDGRKLYFEPWYVLGQYKAEQTAVTRDLLHLLLHLIYRHSFIGKETVREYWDLAADIAVENTVNELALPSLTAKRQLMQRDYIEILTRELGTLTAERIYKWLREGGATTEEAGELRRLFMGDEHGIWYGSNDPNAVKIDIDLQEVWEEVSKRMETELELLQKDEGSPLLQNLKSLNRARYNYTDFLRRFGVWGESMRLSEDEFDNNYYSYGLATYGNMPLIEPLEYREQKKIKEFVIAIDTSGSVRGDVVQSFIQHTNDILQKQENFFTKVNMHIIQCDDRIREDVCITGREDFESYIANLEIKGLVQTDFRPVFEYVDELIRKRELTELKGLIYFTDGLGIFPSAKPAYETAVILHRGDYDEPPVPVWAMHMALNDEEVLNLGKQ